MKPIITKNYKANAKSRHHSKPEKETKHMSCFWGFSMSHRWIRSSQIFQDSAISHHGNDDFDHTTKTQGQKRNMLPWYLSNQNYFSCGWKQNPVVYLIVFWSFMTTWSWCGITSIIFWKFTTIFRWTIILYPPSRSIQG